MTNSQSSRQNSMKNMGNWMNSPIAKHFYQLGLKDMTEHIIKVIDQEEQSGRFRKDTALFMIKEQLGLNQ